MRQWAATLTGGLAVLRWQAWLSSAIVHGLGLVILSLIILATPLEEPAWLIADLGAKLASTSASDADTEPHDERGAHFENLVRRRERAPLAS